MNRQARINREKGNDDEHRRSHYRNEHHERSHVENEAWRKEGQNSKGRDEGGQEKGQGNDQTEIEVSAGSWRHEEGDRARTPASKRRSHHRGYRQGDPVAEPQYPRLHQRNRATLVSPLGATAEELRKVLPGDEIFPNAHRS